MQDDLIFKKYHAQIKYFVIIAENRLISRVMYLDIIILKINLWFWEYYKISYWNVSRHKSWSINRTRNKNKNVIFVFRVFAFGP